MLVRGSDVYKLKCSAEGVLRMLECTFPKPSLSFGCYMVISQACSHHSQGFNKHNVSQLLIAA